MLSTLYVRLTIKVKEGIPESFKVGWYRHKITGSSDFNLTGSQCSKYKTGVMCENLGILKIIFAAQF